MNQADPQFDLDYYRDRIATERRAADEAAHPAAARSHRRLAERYAALVGDGDDD